MFLEWYGVLIVLLMDIVLIFVFWMLYGYIGFKKCIYNLFYNLILVDVF